VVRIKELEGQHNGEHMAEEVMEFIREYGIASEVGYFMMDNASNMNSMIDKVSDDLEREFDVFYDPLPHRLRCSSHVIDLPVMEFLMGKRPPTTDFYGGPSEEDIEQWRKRGAIGKLHNIVANTVQILYLSCPVCLVPRLVCRRWKQGNSSKWAETGSECQYNGVSF
jgi:hypothetical protein